MYEKPTIEVVGDVGVGVENVFVEATVEAVKDGVEVENVHEEATIEVIEMLLKVKVIQMKSLMRDWWMSNGTIMTY